MKTGIIMWAVNVALGGAAAVWAYRDARAPGGWPGSIFYAKVFAAIAAGSAAVVVVLLATSAFAADLAPGQSMTVNCIEGAAPTPGPGPTPRPTLPTTSRPPSCPQGSLTQHFGRNVFGIQSVSIAEGQKHIYCAHLLSPARRVRMEVSIHCVGGNVELKVTPGAATYSDGATPMPVVRSSRSANYGSLTRPPAWVMPQTFVVDVTGMEVGTDCPGDKSVYTLLWMYDS